jgi:hypothetical protein
MLLLLELFRARDHRGLDGDLEAEDDRRRTRKGRSTAEDAVGETFLAREEWALAQGKKVTPAALRLRRSRRKPVFGQIKPSRGQVFPG